MKNQCRKKTQRTKSPAVLPPPTNVREFLQILNLANMLQKAPPGFRWNSSAALVAEHGTEFTAKVPPPRRLTPKACFWNSIRMVLRNPDRYRYCEGWGLTETCMIPVSHAWCVDDQGRVVDATWTNGVEYVGVVFKTSYAVRAYYRYLKHKVFGLLDAYWDGFRLLTLPPEEWKETQFIKPHEQTIPKANETESAARQSVRQDGQDVRQVSGVPRGKGAYPEISG